MDLNCKCGETKTYIAKKKMHTGVYCSRCDKWLKWVNKKEIKVKNVIDDSGSILNRIESLEKELQDIKIILQGLNISVCKLDKAISLNDESIKNQDSINRLTITC